VYGAGGRTGGPPADPVMNPEGNLPLLVVRRQSRQTVFAAVHEPYRQQQPTIADVRKLAESKDAYVAEVRAKSYLDRVAVAFGEQKGTPLHALRGSRDPQEVFLFRDHAYALYEGASQWRAESPTRILALLGEPLFQRSPERYMSHQQTPFDHVTSYAAVTRSGKVALVAFPRGQGYYNQGFWVYRRAFQKVLSEVLPAPLIQSDAHLTTERR